jgi:phospholipid-transporting ATPase
VCSPAAKIVLLIAVQGNYKNGGAYTFILFITFWILYSYLVPISLFVSLEIVKFWQGFVQMQSDDEM